MLVKPVVLLPSYNNAATLEKIISGVAKNGLDFVVVNDGSTDSTAAILARAKCENVLSFQCNRGKGDALRAGLLWAKQAGYTHAIAMDTDGQHSPDDLGVLVEEIQNFPTALIIGARTFAENVPASSKFGRDFSNFWIRAETGLSLADTQSGFRAYPLESLPIEKTSTTRFDFEIEILVRAAWNEIPVREVPISVYYAPAGERISHFRKWEDNARLSLLHTRLVCTRILRGKPSERRGAMLMRLVAPLTGRYVIYLIAPFVVAFYFLTGKAQRKAIVDFHDRLGTRGLRKYLFSYLNFVYFASVLLDRMLTLNQAKLNQYITVRGDNVPHTGVILVGAHLGDWLVPAFGYFRKRGRRVVVVMNKKGSPQFQKMAKNYEGSPIEFLDSSGDRVEVLLRAREALNDNAVMCFLVDRVDANMRCESVHFLGSDARWASGPFELALLLKVPVFSFLAAKSHPLWKAKQHVFFKQIYDGSARSDTRALVTKFADTLAEMVHNFRFQWYNFFNFWVTK